MRKFDFYCGVILFCTILMLIVAYMRISDLEDRVYDLEHPNTQHMQFESIYVEDLNDINAINDAINDQVNEEQQP